MVDFASLGDTSVLGSNFEPSGLKYLPVAFVRCPSPTVFILGGLLSNSLKLKRSCSLHHGIAQTRDMNFVPHRMRIQGQLVMFLLACYVVDDEELADFLGRSFNKPVSHPV